jgi:hypothetical protein
VVLVAEEEFAAQLYPISQISPNCTPFPKFLVGVLVLGDVDDLCLPLLFALVFLVPGPRGGARGLTNGVLLPDRLLEPDVLIHCQPDGGRAPGLWRNRPNYSNLSA